MNLKSKPLIGQITKFYLTNFLKHQTYFFPIIVLFYQSNHLSFLEIFWLYSIKSVVFVIMEIPSGIIADIIGKNKANIFARFMIIPALLIFIYADSFSMFALANILMNLGDVFKSGKHKAIIYDYLKSHPEIKKSYPEIIGESKVWSRIGEGVASLAGAIIASAFGLRSVFILSLIPAVLNLINALSYEKSDEPHVKKEARFDFKEYVKHFKKTVIFLKKSPFLIFLMINSSIIFFSWSVSSIILQPYLQKLGVSVENFGLIYACFLLAAALASKYASDLGKMIGINKAINYYGWLMIIPFLVLTETSSIPLLLFAFILINFVKSAYHPIMIGELAKKPEAEIRSTVLSIAAMFGSILYFVTLPLTGYILDISNINIVMMITAGALILNQVIFNIAIKKFKAYENF